MECDAEKDLLNGDHCGWTSFSVECN